MSIEDTENNKHIKVLDNCQIVDNIDDFDVLCYFQYGVSEKWRKVIMM